MKNPFAFLKAGEWNVLEDLLLYKGSYTKAAMTYIQGVNHNGPSTDNPSNAFKVSKRLVEKGLVITNTEDQTYQDVITITTAGRSLVFYGRRVHKYVLKNFPPKLI